MFVENAAHPFGDGKQEHVIAISCRPIRDSHAYPMAGDKAAKTDQAECRQRGEDREAVQPGIIRCPNFVQLSEAPAKNKTAATEQSQRYLEGAMLNLQ